MSDKREREERLLNGIIHDKDYDAWKEEVRASCRSGMHGGVEGYGRLLREAVADETYRDFREALRRRCRTRLASHRRGRGARFAAVAAVGTAALLLVLLFRFQPDPRERRSGDTARPQRPQVSSLHVVSTLPLAPRHLVEGRRLSVVESSRAPCSVSSRRTPPGFMVTTREMAGIVRTGKRDSGTMEISDEELLALFPRRPAGLVETGPSRKRLVLFDLDDRKQIFKGWRDEGL